VTTLHRAQLRRAWLPPTPGATHAVIYEARAPRRGHRDLPWRARNGQPDRRNSLSSLTIHWAIVPNHGMSRCPAMPPIPWQAWGECAWPAGRLSPDIFYCGGIPLLPILLSRQGKFVVRGNRFLCGGCPDGSGSSRLLSPGSSRQIDRGLGRQKTRPCFDIRPFFRTPPGRRVGQRRLHWHRPAPSGGPAHLPMMHRAS
jgi:hypothetical protein